MHVIEAFHMVEVLHACNSISINIDLTVNVLNGVNTLCGTTHKARTAEQSVQQGMYARNKGCNSITPWTPKTHTPPANEKAVALYVQSRSGSVEASWSPTDGYIKHNSGTFARGGERDHGRQ
jgi:hypothetical protein